MLIDFTPNFVGGAVRGIVFVWLISGLICFCITGALIIKYWNDLKISVAFRSSVIIQDMCKRRIEACWLRLTIITIVLGTGVYTMLNEMAQDEVAPDAASDPITIFVVMIPIILTIDSIRELYFQQRLLASVTPRAMVKVKTD